MNDLEKIEVWIKENYKYRRDNLAEEVWYVERFDLEQFIKTLKAEKPRYEMEARTGNSTVRAKVDDYNTARANTTREQTSKLQDAMYLSEKPQPENKGFWGPVKILLEPELEHLNKIYPDENDGKIRKGVFEAQPDAGQPTYSDLLFQGKEDMLEARIKRGEMAWEALTIYTKHDGYALIDAVMEVQDKYKETNNE